MNLEFLTTEDYGKRRREDEGMRLSSFVAHGIWMNLLFSSGETVRGILIVSTPGLDTSGEECPETAPVFQENEGQRHDSPPSLSTGINTLNMWSNKNASKSVV